MADTIVPFVVVSGLATGITATKVIGEDSSVPVAVTSFNGLTGAVTGVTVGGANTFTALQTHTVGISSAGLTLTGQFNITNNSPAIDEILTCFDTNGQAKWQSPPAIVHQPGLNRWLFPYFADSYATTATTISTTQVNYFGFIINSTCFTRAGIGSISTAPTTTGTCTVKVYAAGRTSGAPVGPPIGDYGTITVTGSGSTMFTSSLGVTLSPGFYWVALGSGSAAINNLRRLTTTTQVAPRLSGLASPVGSSTIQIGLVGGAGTTLPPDTVGALTEVTSNTVTPILLVV